MQKALDCRKDHKQCRECGSKEKTEVSENPITNKLGKHECGWLGENISSMLKIENNLDHHQAKELPPT